MANFDKDRSQISLTTYLLWHSWGILELFCENIFCLISDSTKTIRFVHFNFYVAKVDWDLLLLTITSEKSQARNLIVNWNLEN